MTEVSDLIPVRRALLSSAFRFSNEADIQDGVEALLRRAGIAFERERVIGAFGRIDFLTAGGTGIEVKYFGCSVSNLTRQIYRYTESDEVRALLVVSPRTAHDGISRTLNGKTVSFVHAAAARGAF